MNKNTFKASQILIVTGLVVLLSAVAVGVYALADDYRAGHRAQQLLEQMRQHSSPVSQSVDVPTEKSRRVSESVSSTLREQETENVPSAQTEPPSDAANASEMPAVDYDTVGVLKISKLGLELPILSEWSDNLAQVSICRYMGDALDKPERLVIAGHNYRSHFGRLNQLVPGDEVVFVSSEGMSYSYTVSELSEISMTDHQTLAQGEWDITLFTCGTDRQRRILVRCLETDGNVEFA